MWKEGKRKKTGKNKNIYYLKGKGSTNTLKQLQKQRYRNSCINEGLCKKKLKRKTEHQKMLVIRRKLSVILRNARVKLAY